MTELGVITENRSYIRTWSVCYGLKLELVKLKATVMYMLVNKISKSQTCLITFNYSNQSLQRALSNSSA